MRLYCYPITKQKIPETAAAAAAKRSLFLQNGLASALSFSRPFCLCPSLAAYYLHPLLPFLFPLDSTIS